jgi:hypothetical protein
MLRLSVTAHSASEAVGNCRKNAQVHAQVLRMYDIANITSAKQGWWENERTSVLLMQDAVTREPLGAVRLQRWGNGIPLPIELALASVDPRVHEWVGGFADDGVGELCGLWCSPRLRGFSLGKVLTRMGLSIATQLRTRTILGLCDARSVSTNEALGFVRDPELASAGTFEYPRPGLNAHVLRIDDALRLDRATHHDWLAIDEYREEPVGRELVEGRDGWLELERDLRLVPGAGVPCAPLERSTRRPGIGEVPALRARL